MKTITFALAATPVRAQTQPWPQKTVRFIVPLPPGVDVMDLPTVSGFPSIDIPADLRVSGR